MAINEFFSFSWRYNLRRNDQERKPFTILTHFIEALMMVEANGRTTHGYQKNCIQN